MDRMVLLVSLVLELVLVASGVVGHKKVSMGPFRCGVVLGFLPRAIAGGIGGSLSIVLSYRTLTAANSMEPMMTLPCRVCQGRPHFITRSV
ncbi:hypothetical protein QBC45DRAFT_134219 [Copromyces sp. CBS 386.78]|nr:hypothetical protein QBC45DRAFT_134219 [Copromyces sp. CBS 386.78]